MNFKSKKGPLGYTLIEVLVALGLASIVAIAILALMNQMQQGSRDATLGAALEARANEIRVLLANKQSFLNTIRSSMNPNMACLLTRPTCNCDVGCADICSAKTQCPASRIGTKFDQTQDSIALFNTEIDPTGVRMYWDGRHPGTVPAPAQVSTMGFTATGAKCSGFAYQGVGNDSCPFGYAISWYTDGTGTTSGILVTIAAKLIFNPGPQDNIFAQRLNATLTSEMSRYDVKQTHRLDSIADMRIGRCSLDGLILDDKATGIFYNTRTPQDLDGDTYFTCEQASRTCNVVNGVGVLEGNPAFAFSECKQDCQGYWNPCTATCGGGTRDYRLMVPSNGAPGARNDCPVAGATMACNTGPCVPNQPCAGVPTSCSQSCGGGTESWVVTQNKTGTGADCTWDGVTVYDGFVRACATYPACTADVNCAGDFGTCSTTCGPGVRTYAITQPAAGSGAVCPFAPGATIPCNRGACPVDCVGAWGACGSTVLGVQIYAVTSAATDGGVDCEAPDTARRICGTQCQGYWSPWSACSVSCGAGTQSRSYTVVQAAAGGGANCVDASGGVLATGSVQTKSCNLGECGRTCGATVYPALDGVPNNTTCGGGLKTCDIENWYFCNAANTWQWHHYESCVAPTAVCP